ncbi:MAG: threonine synthase [Acidobacteriota bacterium]
MFPRTSDSWARDLRCSRDDHRAPLDEPAFLSPEGVPWLVSYDLDRQRGASFKEALSRRPWTLWRYRELLPLADFDRRIDLGEGGTPLITLNHRPGGARLVVKEEGGNPTGSFKARGLSLAVNRARELGAPGVELPSAGNAALALSAYAAAAGLPARVAVPGDTPATVLRRCREHGAEVLTSSGTLVEAAGRLAEDDRGYWNLSTLKEPYRAEGKKTMGLELAEQLDWQLPDWIVYPTGGGTGIVGMAKAFDELEALGLIGSHRPRFVVVQMAGCAPLVRAFEAGAERAETWANPHTEVWGLRVPKAIGDFIILNALRRTNGLALAIAEDRLPAITDQVARTEGVRLGPEGAACWAAIEDLAEAGEVQAGQQVVLFQTGNPDNYL